MALSIFTLLHNHHDLRCYLLKYYICCLPAMKDEELTFFPFLAHMYTSCTSILYCNWLELTISVSIVLRRHFAAESLGMLWLPFLPCKTLFSNFFLCLYHQIIPWFSKSLPIAFQTHWVSSQCHLPEDVPLVGLRRRCLFPARAVVVLGSPCAAVWKFPLLMASSESWFPISYHLYSSFSCFGGVLSSVVSWERVDGS